ncbi:MAG: NAD-dependent epimerase/dehydratase family protein [Pseudomonadota bacterium]
MKNVLVIGGSYFAGRVFVETLSKSNRVNLYVFNRGHLPIGIQSVGQIIGDRDIPETISRGIPEKHWDVVIDFCAYTPEHITTLLQSIPGTLGHYIFISTTSIYAPTRNVPISEKAPKVMAPQPELGEFAEYGYLKWLAECACERECRQRGIPYTILRPAIIYGRYNYAPRESFFFDHVIANKPLAIPENPNFFYSFVWVEDLAEIIVACMENEKTYGQAFNVAGEERISYWTMADMIEEVCGRTLQRRKMSTEDIIRERVPMPFPPDEHLLYDGSKLRTVLGYEHTPFLLGIAKTWRNYQAVVQRRIEMQGGA